FMRFFLRGPPDRRIISVKLRTLPLHGGPRVRIHLPPAASPVRTRLCRAHRPCRCAARRYQEGCAPTDADGDEALLKIELGELKARRLRPRADRVWRARALFAYKTAGRTGPLSG